MKRILILLFWICSLLVANAQQKPHYTQYVLNPYIINPALTGIENYTDIKLSHRHQWVGIQDAPVTTYLTIHTALGKKDFRTSATSYRVPGENPRGKSYWDDYTAAEPHHGIGLQVINDRTGPLNRFSAYGTYAYHVGISARTSLAAGFGAGVSNLSLTASKLDFGVANPVDPAVYTSKEINSIEPDFNAGVWLYSADYFLGLAAQQIIPSKVDFSNGVVTTKEGKLVPHLFLNAGYRFGHKWYAGLNIDLVGFSIGSTTPSVLLSNGSNKAEPVTKPSSGNLLLTGDLDYGSLNSEFFVKYNISPRWDVKLVYQFFFT